MGEIPAAVFALTAAVTLLAMFWAVNRRSFRLVDGGGDDTSMAATKLVDTHRESGLDVSGLEPLTQVKVRTDNSLYHLTVLNPGESKVLIQGGRFAEPVEASLGHGSGFLKANWIGLGVPMEIFRETGPVTTSPVRSVRTKQDSRRLYASSRP